jgi:glycosyltransferase involved in cell wall biosynthesis
VNVYFVVLNEMMTGVIASQVIAPARSYAEAFPDLSVRIVLLEPARVFFSRRARARLDELRRIWPAGRVGVYPYIGRLSEFAPALSLKALVRATAGRSTSILFHCRGPGATIQAAHVARHMGGRVVFDARGASDHEAVLRLNAQGPDNDASLLQRAFDFGARMDQLAVKLADAVVAVSEPLARKLQQVNGGEQKPMAVIPSCVERPLFSSSARQGMRRKLGVPDNELLFVHTSTEARWEAFDQVLDLFRAVNLRQRSRMLFLTTLDPSVVTASLSASDPLLETLIILKARPEEVSQYLSAADVGLLLRRPHETFRVASPIKFAEYLGAGLALVVSENIGTTNEIVEAQKLGVIVPEGSNSSAIDEAAECLISIMKHDPDALRARAIEVCKELYVWDRYTPVISQLYGLH